MSFPDALGLMCSVVGTLAGVIGTVVAVLQYRSSRQVGARRSGSAKITSFAPAVHTRATSITDPTGFEYEELYLAVRSWIVTGAIGAFVSLAGAVIGFNLSASAVRHHPVGVYLLLPLAIIGVIVILGAGWTSGKALVYGYYALAALALIGIAAGCCTLGSAAALISHFHALHADGFA
ncbi:MAG: hypothetical protein JOY82_22180 [Streptosporangiaceae bacterium]|nr:hypothetical protein [Streptosporangiaceae bacterium]MBV9857193.1 hypothetical protein [Streptosporangiaceae bacterium]